MTHLRSCFILIILLLLPALRPAAQPAAGALAPDSLPAPAGLAPDAAAQALAATITAEELRQHLGALASEAFEGRETGTEGQQLAAAYLAGQFEALGLTPAGDSGSYLQRIAFISESWNSLSLEINGKTLRNLWEFYAYPATNPENDSLTTDEMLFLGYGIRDKRYDDYAGRQVRGKVLLVLDGEPLDADSVSHLTGRTERSSWSTDWRRKVRTAREAGARAILIIDRHFKENLQEARKVILNSGLRYGDGERPETSYIPNFFISSSVAREIIGDQYEAFIKTRTRIERSGRPRALNLPVSLRLHLDKWVRQLEGENVVGVIEGSDPARKDELVLLSAHYDHLGKRGNAIYFGADDNASGTSALLEVAGALAQARRQGDGPRRSVMILLVSGEEKGLLGSDYYVQHPRWPLEQTIVNVNVDMVGRVDDKHADNPYYIYVIGADRLSTDLHHINEQANTTYTQLALDYTYNDPADPNRYYYRSDHYNFARRGIPAIFFFNGTHQDYHRISDTIDKIHFDKMERITRLVFHTTWELANRDERIRVDGETEKN